MIFTEFRFFWFFAGVFVAYWGLPWFRARKLFLLVASYAFYAAWDWRFLGLIWLSTVVDYVVGLWLERSAAPRARRALLIASLGVNLGLLGFFKYFDFFVSSLRDLFEAVGVPFDGHTLGLLLPVGISFYTFQTLSYTIDVYRGRLRATRDPFDFALFVAFFPQLVAGPIVRARDFLPQTVAPRRFDTVRVRALLTLFLIGFFKKACIADNVAVPVDAYFADPGSYGGASVWIAMTLYSIQIYCDFSGYSDMAIACAGLLGFELCVNFRHPYLAANITDFWHRWHISLSTWLRDYLYIPLGGNRRGRARTYANLMLTMVLGGLWHGAGWGFVIWGTLHGGALAVHKKWRAARSATRAGMSAAWVIPLSTLATFFWVGLAYVFFRAPTISGALEIAQRYLFVPSAGAERLAGRYVVLIAALVLLHWVSSRVDWVARAERRDRLSDAGFAAAYGGAFALAISMMALEYKPFIYFQF